MADPATHTPIYPYLSKNKKLKTNKQTDIKMKKRISITARGGQRTQMIKANWTARERDKGDRLSICHGGKFLGDTSVGPRLMIEIRNDHLVSNYREFKME